MKIPFLNLAQLNHSIKAEIDEAIQKVLLSGQLVGGDTVKSFEKNFADYHGAKHCISTGNGTDSLFAALKRIGVGPGDEVITPAWSWISTSETISLTGAKPMFADVDEKTFLLSAMDVEKKITSQTKAVLAVHLYGQCCDIEALQAICTKHHLILIEDCAQAHGTKRNGRMAGTFGNISSFSFYPTKNLGALGDAGCLLTNDDAMALKLRRFVNHGGLSKDEHLMEGMNSRMDSMQAAVLNMKLKYLETWNERRRAIASVYNTQLKNISELKLPTEDNGNQHVYHLYVIRTARRDELKSYLAEQGVETMIHYPQALPFEPAYARFNFKAQDFPVAHQLQQEVLSLPCNPMMMDEETEYICAMMKKY